MTVTMMEMLMKMSVTGDNYDEESRKHSNLITCTFRRIVAKQHQQYLHSYSSFNRLYLWQQEATTRRTQVPDYTSDKLNRVVLGNVPTAESFSQTTYTIRCENLL